MCGGPLSLFTPSPHVYDPLLSVSVFSQTLFSLFPSHIRRVWVSEGGEIAALLPLPSFIPSLSSSADLWVYQSVAIFFAQSGAFRSSLLLAAAAAAAGAEEEEEERKGELAA